MLTILYNVIGGIIVAILSFLYIRCGQNISNWFLRKVLGIDFRREGIYHIIYGKFILPTVYNEKHEPITHPYKKQSKKTGRESSISIENPISSCEVRAANYMSLMFGRYRACTPTLASDDDMFKDLDLSFISLGGPFSNYKTNDVLYNTSNRLVKMSTNNFVTAETERKILSYEHGFDYGLILRIRPSQFQQRVWIVCAGIGEWGTSGAAWYLSHKWQELVRKNLRWYNPLGFGKGSDFAAIIKVERDIDQSATLLKLFRSPQEVEVAADDFEKSAAPSSVRPSSSASSSSSSSA